MHSTRRRPFILVVTDDPIEIRLNNLMICFRTIHSSRKHLKIWMICLPRHSKKNMHGNISNKNQRNSSHDPGVVGLPIVWALIFKYPHLPQRLVRMDDPKRRTVIRPMVATIVATTTTTTMLVVVVLRVVRTRPKVHGPSSKMDNASRFKAWKRMATKLKKSTSTMHWSNGLLMAYRNISIRLISNNRMSSKCELTSFISTSL
mmetsp:Transcript_11742/g.22526  ORF Transcript_11742/g.22526 Transcript_11742/m.22526 type:complete len:203 (-) Transcript_11742:10-618(-)